MAFRGVGLTLCIGTNCSVWAVNPEEEKLLGEALGDVCGELGLADTLAVKIVFAAGVVGGVFGPKALGYLAYRQQLAEQAELMKKGNEKKPEQPVTAPKGKDPLSDFETKPGLQ